MKPFLRVLLCGLGLGAAVAAQQLTRLYRQVANPQLDSNRIAVVEAVHFHRDRLHFQLQQGFLGLARPVQGHVTAAVFSGSGVLTVLPPDPINAAMPPAIADRASRHNNAPASGGRDCAAAAIASPDRPRHGRRRPAGWGRGSGARQVRRHAGRSR